MTVVNSIAGQTLDDVYVILANPPTSINGVNSSAVGVVGSVSRGIPGAIYTFSNYDDFVQKLGQSASNLTGPIAVQNLVRQQAGDIYFVPVFGQGASAASVTLEDASSNPVLILTFADQNPQTGALQTSYGTYGNGVSVTVTAGTGSTYNLTVTSPSGRQDKYTNLTPAQAVTTINATATIAIASFPTLANPTGSATLTPSTTGGTLSGGTVYVKWTWTNAIGETLASNEATVTIAAGSTGSFTFTPPTAPTAPSGASGYKLYVANAAGAETLSATATSATATTTVTALPAAGSASPPTTNSASIIPSTVAAVGTFEFAGGSNGAATVDGDYIGTTLTNGQKTGLAALAAAPQLSFVMAAEQYSSAINSALATFANANNCIAVLALAPGTTPSTAETSVVTTSQDNVIWAYPWQVAYDADVSTNRTSSPVSFVCGVGSVQGPEQSLGNKSISGSLATDVPLAIADITGLVQANIMVVGVSIPAGGTGIRNGQASSGKQVYVQRMRYFIALSVNNSMGWAVDQLQSTDTKDPLRRQVKNSVDSFLQGLMGNPATGVGRMIDSYSTVCDLTNNNSQTIANHELNCDVSVNLLSAAEKVVIRANIAEGVLTVTHQ